MRSHIHLLVGAQALLLALAGAGAAQTPVSVRGVVFDSLRGQPLKDALVMVVGARVSATTDDRGRFRLDGVAPGVRTFTVMHALLDTVGFPGLSRRLPVSDSSHEVRLAVPSFPTLWRAACGGTPPTDSGFVYGTVRNVADRSPVANAAVEVAWIVTVYDKGRGIRQRRVFGETTTDANGNYAVCGVPGSHWVKVIAATIHASGGVDVPPGELRVQHRDLFIGPTVEQDSTSRGSIVGLLTDQDGAPFSEARIVLDDSTEVRSGGDGRFALRNVQAGTRVVEIMSIGMVPAVMAVDVFPRDSASITMQIRRVTTLDVIRVTGSRRGRIIAEGIEERRRTGFGYSMTMTELHAHSSFATVLADFPGIRMRQNGGDYAIEIADGRGGVCAPEIWLDGARMSLAALHMVLPRDVMAAEYFPRATMLPTQFRRTDMFTGCGAILVWTNWALSR
jgi:hypothetical protein